MKNITIILSSIILILLIISGAYFWRKNNTDNTKITRNIKIDDNNIQLKVGTAADFPPFTFRDENDQIIGFDIDIVKEVAKRIKADIDIIDRPFSMLLTQAQLGQLQIIAAGISATKEREKHIRFTKPYLEQNPLIIISPKNKNINIKNIEDIKSKNVIVNTGYITDTYISNLPEDYHINIIRLSKVQDSIIALNHNKGDVFVTTKIALSPYLKGENQNKYNIFQIPGTSETTSLAVSKHVPQELFDKIQQALDAMKTDGTLEKFKEKWNLLT